MLSQTWHVDIQRRVLGLVLLSAAGIGATLFIPRIAQNPDYHNFADRRAILGVPNFFDVVSNVPFGLAGALGLIAVQRASRGGLMTRADRTCFAVAFVGMILTAAGSAYYHWSPNNQTLIWDRMGLTLAFTAFMAAMLGERIRPWVGMAALVPLLVLGAASVAYWVWTESRGAGDLRPYAFVQFFPLLALIYMLVAFPARFFPTGDVALTLGWYALARVFEVLDRSIFTLDGGLISGHTLKHLAAGMACYWIARTLGRAARLPAVGPAVGSLRSVRGRRGRTARTSSAINQ